jgi:hypothetical protein
MATCKAIFDEKEGKAIPVKETRFNHWAEFHDMAPHAMRTSTPFAI